MKKPNLIQIAKLYWRAWFHPEPAAIPRTKRQYKLLQPRYQNIRSLKLQIADLKRLPDVDGADMQENDHFGKVFRYNASVTVDKLITTTRRAEIYYQILSIPPRDLSEESLLIVGPRNIQEFVLAEAYGFNWNHMSGLDLYSTNPKIVVGNMENMPWEANTFDCMSMAHTFAYADDAFKCLSEMHRVLKPGGRVAFGFNYSPKDPEWKTNRIPPEKIIEFAAELGFFKYFHEMIEKVNAINLEQQVIWLGLRKAGK